MLQSWELVIDSCERGANLLTFMVTYGQQCSPRPGYSGYPSYYIFVLQQQCAL